MNKTIDTRYIDIVFIYVWINNLFLLIKDTGYLFKMKIEYYL